MDKSRYDKVLEACALSEDLKSLQDGDDTEIGANGVNLSGGQKWRVTLARAVYSRAEILLMEDIFSAVDSHVGAQIYDRCLTGDICRGRTRIIVTHHLSLVVPGASFVVELGDGGVLYSGPPKLSTHHQPGVSDTDAKNTTESVDSCHDPLLSTNGSETEPSKSDAVPKKFMQEEIRQKGNVKRGVYLTYVKGSGGLLPWALCIGIYLAYQAGILGRAWVLRIWTARSSMDANSLASVHHISGSTFSTTQLLSHHSKHITPDPNVIFYLKIYIAISVATAGIGILRYLSSYFLAVKASRSLFERMLFAVMHAPLRWLDTVHSGRILNRFTADFNIIDERIAMTWSQFFSHLLRLISICIASCFTSAYLIPPAVVLLAIGAITGNKYLVASRPLKRLESNAKSPVFELFNTTLAGISTIRAFRRTQTYLEQMHNNLNAWTMTTFYIALANRWMSLRMALITALFSITVGIVIVVKQIDAALAGLALSFILDFSESLRWTIRSYGDMELEMNSMERVVEYMNIETEFLGGLRPAAAWPSSGSIEVKDLEVAYAPDLPPVLKGLSFKIRHGERIGVVGRTGAGKSSMTLALFRFLEARSGSVAIDGVDISKLKLTDLRSKMSIIPQVRRSQGLNYG
jgi:ABC-type multidrug transport system fused ATPase/permease subunit